MTIAELEAGGKTAGSRIPTSWLVVGIIILSSSASFGLGVLQGREGEQSQLSVTQLATSTPPAALTTKTVSLPAAAAAAAPAAPALLPAGGQYVASKNGTKYYLPWCGTVKNIKEENKVWFASKEAAEAAGFQPAANCKGL